MARTQNKDLETRGLANLRVRMLIVDKMSFRSEPREEPVENPKEQ